MAKSMVVTCDVCGAEGARSYGVTVEDQKWSVDLCDDHAEPVMTLAREGQRGGGDRSVHSGPMRALEARIRGVPDIPEEPRA